MTYSEWCDEMQRLLDTAFSYGYGTIGSKLYVEKMAELSEEYPEYDERWENGEVKGND